MLMGPAPLLVIRRQDSNPAQIEWSQPVLSIGRDGANDIVIDHPLASRRHARLERDDNGYLVRDLDSTNGTYVNGDRIEGARALHNQDRIWVADAEIIFNDPEATQKGPLPAEILRRVRAAEEAIRLDSRAKEVFVQGKLVDPPLTVKEFQLLEVLLRRAGQVVTRTMLLEAVWDFNFDPHTNVVDVHVSRLRRAVDRDFDRPLIHTVRGAGYMLRAG